MENMLDFIICNLKKRINKEWIKCSWMCFFLIPFSILYGLIVFIRSFFYKKIFCNWKSPVPVVIVGNLTIGGNGKTPLVIWLVKKLTSMGYKVGVISRGYKGKSKCYPILVGKTTSFREVGDEAILIYLRTKTLISVDPNRVNAVKMLLKKKVDLIISDDGLQHYKLARNYEILVIDGNYRFGNGLLLPSGPLREFKSRLHTVNVIVLNDGFTKNNEVFMKYEGNTAINLLNKKKNLSIN